MHDLDAMAERNLAAMEQHRPALLEKLLAEAPDDRFQLAAGPDGKLTVAQRIGEGLEAVVPGADPAAHLRRIAPQIPTNVLQGVGVAGIGDGTFLNLLLRLKAPEDGIAIEQPVVVVEPELNLLRAALVLQDLTGVMASPRFLFCVGPDWEAQLLDVLVEEARISAPATFLPGGRLRRDIQAGVQRVASFHERVLRGLQERLFARYAGRSGEACARAIRGEAGREPRVFLLTSRFTTVLQHSTRSLADAFRQAGFDAVVHLEEAKHHRVSPIGLTRALLDHQPDLFVVLNHLRREYGGHIPRELPFLCWIQDRVPHLTHDEAGRSVGARDFVWTRLVDQYVDQYAYPAAQMIEGGLLTKARPVVRRPAQHDLVYFSHASHGESRIRQEARQWIEPLDLDGAVLDRLLDALFEGYAAGRSWENVFDLIVAVAPELGEPPVVTHRWEGHRIRRVVPPTAAGTYARALHLSYSWIHRQQGLRWAADLARREGLDLAIYGLGWHRRPAFAPFARGPADYEKELVPVMQGSRINLGLEPWATVSHWRGLDAAASGATLLARRYRRSDEAPARLLALLEALGLSDAERLEEAVERCPPGRREPLLAEAAAVRVAGIHLVDPVQAAREVPGLLPHDARYGFETPEELAERVAWILEHPEEVRADAAARRRHVLARHTYDAAVGKLVGTIAERLVATASDASPRLEAASA
jgi:hypothetical protein